MVKIKVYAIDLSKNCDKCTITKNVKSVQYARKVAQKYNELFANSKNIAVVRG